MLEWVRAYRFRRRCKRLFWEFQTSVAQSLYPGGNIRVLSGPFAGMAYFNDVVWGPITPKWIGSYEEELHDLIVDEIMTSDYSVIIDVGAAEGFYAVGLARAYPNSQVCSFDIDPYARRLQHRLATLNGIDNLKIGKRCSDQELNELLTNGGLVISDIEGSEFELINPAASPNLRESDILVEVHKYQNHSREYVRDAIRKRFAATHQATVIRSRRREPSTYADVCRRLLEKKVLAAALYEHRNSIQEWLWLKAIRSSPSP